MIKKIHQIGTSKCIILPKIFMNLMKLDSEVEITFDGKQIIIKKPEKK